MPIPWQKYSEEVTSFLIDFGDDLAGDAIIGTPDVVGTDGLTATQVTVEPSPATGAPKCAVKCLLSGGTAGVTATVTCLVATAGGQKAEAKPLIDILRTGKSCSGTILR